MILGETRYKCSGRFWIEVWKHGHWCTVVAEDGVLYKVDMFHKSDNIEKLENFEKLEHVHELYRILNFQASGAPMSMYGPE